MKECKGGFQEGDRPQTLCGWHRQWCPGQSPSVEKKSREAGEPAASLPEPPSTPKGEKIEKTTQKHIETSMQSLV